MALSLGLAGPTAATTCCWPGVASMQCRRLASFDRRDAHASSLRRSGGGATSSGVRHVSGAAGLPAQVVTDVAAELRHLAGGGTWRLNTKAASWKKLNQGLWRTSELSGSEEGLELSMQLFDALRDHSRAHAPGEMNACHYIAAFTACKKRGQWKRALEIYEDMKKVGSSYNHDLMKSAVFGELLLAICCMDKDGEWETVDAILEDMIESGASPNSFTLNALMTAMNKGGQQERAEGIFKDMIAKGVKPNGDTLSWMNREMGVIDIATELQHLEDGGAWRLSPEQATSCIANGGPFMEALELFDAMRERVPDKVGTSQYNAAITACVEPGEWQMAEMFFEDMPAYDVMPDTATFIALIGAVGSCGQWEKAEQIFFKDMQAAGVRPDALAFSALLRALEKCGQSERANDIKGHRPKDILDAIQWLEGGFGWRLESTTVTALMVESSNTVGGCKWALKLFDAMSEHVPDKVGARQYAAAITACKKSVGLWENAFARREAESGVHARLHARKAFEIYESMKARGVKPNLFAFSELISAMQDGSQWERAEEIFNDMAGFGVRPNAVVFNSLISAMKHAGQHARAEEIFEVMVASGVKPNSGTPTRYE